MNKLFSLVLDVSFQGAIAGVIILLVRFLTRKRLSARWHRLLWVILLVKLLLPYGPLLFHQRVSGSPGTFHRICI